MVDHGCARNSFVLLRNLVFAIVLYGGIFTFIEFIQTGSINPVAGLRPSNLHSHKSLPPSAALVGAGVPISETDGTVEIKLGFSKKVVINPHANSFNRPHSLVNPKDDYLGPRPHVDTVANLSLLVERCRGTLEGLEKMRNVFDCLKFFADGEQEYYALPPESKRASKQDPQQSEYALPAGHDQSLTEYVASSEATPASKSSIGTCAGPVIPYHVYWTGPATWRVEIFVKSYLYTQNLPCSRLWLWLDADRDVTAVDDLLHNDPLFERFLPLVERGDIVVKSWEFPSRIPLPKGLDNTDGVGYYKHPGVPNADGEFVVADGVVEDADGQQWLTLTPKQMTFLPVAVSDAVRFVVLHLYGGVYLDMDVLLLRDLRPLLLPDAETGEHAFAERWAAHSTPGDYNTAVMSLKANSSLSSYLLRGGVRMGLNFHPRVIGRMAWKDGRNQELLMLETAAFDPIWTEFNGARAGPCMYPCFADYNAAFKGKPNAVKGEWDDFDGKQLEEIGPADGRNGAAQAHGNDGDKPLRPQRHRRRFRTQDSTSLGMIKPAKHLFTLSSASSASIGNALPILDEARLRSAGVIKDYIPEQDRFPPTNRTLQHFFRGAWSYHVHNQVRASLLFFTSILLRRVMVDI